MNLHALMDELGMVRAARAAGEDKYFARSLDSPSIAEVARALTFMVPAWTGTGAYEVPTNTAVGPTDPAFAVARWLGAGKPVILYHHGSRERAFTFTGRTSNTFKRIFLHAEPPLGASLIVIRAPFHGCLHARSCSSWGLCGSWWLSWRHRCD